MIYHKCSKADWETKLFLCPVGDGWRAHARGISEILKLRGPSEDIDSIWLNLCTRLRIICVRLVLCLYYNSFLIYSIGP
jgi:hypothetical protein